MNAAETAPPSAPYPDILPVHQSGEKVKRPACPAWHKPLDPQPIIPDVHFYGVPTGRRNCFWTLDLDVKNGKNGVERLRKHIVENGLEDLPETRTVRTPSGGFHLDFALPEGRLISTGKEMFEKTSGIDWRGEGGYVCRGGPYTVMQDVPLADAPEWLLALVEKKEAPPAVAVSAIDETHVDWAWRVSKAEAFLASEPPSISGQGGDAQLLKIALRMARTYELPHETSLGLIMAAGGWNSRCEPPWSGEDILRKLVFAAERGTGPTGCFGPDAFPNRGAPQPLATVPLLDRMLATNRQDDEDGDDTPCAQPPEIVLKPGDLHHNIAEACAAVGRDPNVFQRGNELVRLVRVAETDADRAHVKGTPTIVPLCVPTLKPILTRVAIFKKYAIDAATGKIGPVTTGPTSDIVSGVLKNTDGFPFTRVINGITETPVLRPDGSILQRPGYDRVTGYLYAPTAEFPSVPEAPTQEDARRAYAELKEVFAEFPHADGPCSEVPLAAVLTIIARPAIEGNVPAFAFDAATRGSGKTLETDAISMIATGRPVCKSTWPGKNDEEVEKIFGGYALQSVPLFSFDNVGQTAAIGGPTFDKYITSLGAIIVRVLGASKNAQCKWQTVVLFTGNNIAYRGDALRRVIAGRLESPLERPEERKDFRHHPLLPWVKAERPRLVVAALTLLRAFVLAGRPSCGVPRLGSFEEWSSLIPAAIVWAGGEDVTKARPADDADEETDALGDLLAAWPEGETFSSDQLFAKANSPRPPPSPGAFFTADPFTLALANFLSGADDAKQVTWRLKKVAGRVKGGRKLQLIPGHVKKWQVLQVRAVAA